MMELTIRPSVRLECSVCRLPIVKDPDRSDLAEAALFGWVEFAVCPLCGKRVKEFKAPDYVSRAEAFVAKVRRLHEEGSELEVAHLGAEYELEEVSEDEHP